MRITVAGTGNVGLSMVVVLPLDNEVSALDFIVCMFKGIRVIYSHDI